MKGTLFLSNGTYTILQVLSSNFPFHVLKASDQYGKHVVIKTTFDRQETITSSIDTFKSYYSKDWITSIWYGHERAHIDEEKGEKFLEEQFNYLKQCNKEYNLGECLLANDSTGKLFLIYDYINGDNFSSLRFTAKNDLFLRMIPAMLRAVAKFPHGDLSFNNIIIHENKNKFSLIDPAVHIGLHFFTNTECYPLVPPLFKFPEEGYANFADQLAIGLMLYKCLTGINPLSKFTNHPHWENSFGSPLIQSDTSDIDSVMSIYPDTWPARFNFYIYTLCVKKLLNIRPGETVRDPLGTTGLNNYLKPFPQEFFDIAPPKYLNPQVPVELSECCMSLIHSYSPINTYIQKVKEIISKTENEETKKFRFF